MAKIARLALTAFSLTLLLAASGTAQASEKKAEKKTERKARPAPHGKTALRSSTVAPAHAPAKADPAPTGTGRPLKLPKVKPPCFHDPVTVVHFNEEDSFPLTRCDGSVAPLAQERLSVLARPGSAAKPQTDPMILADAKGDKLTPGIRRVDPLLVERVQMLVDHFAKARHARQAKIFVVSGYRPGSTGSYHASGRALDIRLDGVTNEALVAFCKTLPDTGCGYYPNSSFIHIDVRGPGAGHISWIDASGPGESPRYVSAWPPPAAPASPSERAIASVEEALAKLDRALPALPTDEHPAEVTRPSVQPAPPPVEVDEDENREASRGTVREEG
jgi:hypothetical protein